MKTILKYIQGFNVKEALGGILVEISGKPPDKRTVPLLCRHIGHSMSPTVCDLDLLEVEPYGNRPIRPGDVIFCRPSNTEQPVVHRVITNSPDKICTRGDNNAHPDPWQIAPKDILGRVVAAWRGPNKRSLAGGRAGHLWGVLMRLRRAFLQNVALLLGIAYLALARSGIFRFGLCANFKPRVLVFQARNCTYYQLLLGKRAVGRYNPSRRRWDIKRPFKLFVDDSALPPNLSD